jgi:hypothetical protein
MTIDQIAEYEDIRKKRMEGIQKADQGCRKLTMGNVPFSDKYKLLTSKIELWKAVVTKKNIVSLVRVNYEGWKNAQESLIHFIAVWKRH